MDYRDGDHIKRQTRVAYGWLVIGQSVGTGLAYAYRRYAPPVCDTKAPLRLRYAACGATYLLYFFVFGCI